MSLPKSLWRWAYYDFANSAYLLVYTALLLPVLFSKLAPSSHSLGSWGLANALATLLGVLFSVGVGYYSDRHSKFSAFRASIVLSFLGMILIAFSARYFVGALYGLYIFTQAFFILSLSLSDSILPHLADSKRAYSYSGFAWGFGYLGGIASLLIVLFLQKALGDEYHPLVFLSTALFYLLFSAYALRGLKGLEIKPREAVVEPVILSRLQRFFLLLGYWLISEGITVIFLFITLYLSNELGFSSLKIGLVLLGVQLIGFPATWYGGHLAGRFNTLSLLGWTILFWGITIVFLVLNAGAWGLALIILFGALAVGNSQSYLRAQYATLIPKNESGFQFGLYTVASEAAVFLGPLVYGLMSDALKSQRIPLMLLFMTMVIGYAMIRRVLSLTDCNLDSQRHQ